ncbi:MAG: inositol monophosphatase family protein [Deltaproteobacteria bacterium]|nr:inositol monophosphatase family protein [Deltaproteobacteria bacterium]
MSEFSNSELQELQSAAVDAAGNAATVISKYRHSTSLNIRRKGEGTLSATVVTEVDVLSQNAVLASLANTRDKYNLAMLSEENPDDGERLVKRAFWCVDPLDGTLPFIEKKAGYAVSIGLVQRDGTPLVGVILDPENNNIYTAVRREGAFCNGTPIVPAKGCASDVLTVVIDRSAYESWQFKQMSHIANHVASELGCNEVDIFNYGGAAMNAMVALTRPPGCYFKFPRMNESGGSLWDYSASACIYKEAGAVTGDIFGNALELNRPDSTFMNHRGFIFATDAQIATVLKRMLQ